MGPICTSHLKTLRWLRPSSLTSASQLHSSMCLPQQVLLFNVKRIKLIPSRQIDVLGRHAWHTVTSMSVGPCTLLSLRDPELTHTLQHSLKSFLRNRGTVAKCSEPLDFGAPSSLERDGGTGRGMAAGRDLIMAAGRDLIRMKRVGGLGQPLTGVGYVVNRQSLPPLPAPAGERRRFLSVIFWERKLNPEANLVAV